MGQTRREIYRFGEFELDTGESVLRQKGEIVPLAPKALQALALLVRSAGRVVSRSDMVESLCGRIESHRYDLDVAEIAW